MENVLAVYALSGTIRNNFDQQKSPTRGWAILLVELPGIAPGSAR